MDEAKPFMTFEELRVEDISAVWEGVDRDAIGRVLSAHLVVEHFMNEALAAEGIDLPRLKQGGIRLTFDGKRRLLGKTGAMVFLSAGIQQLNKIRNDLAHDPTHQLTIDQTSGLYDTGGRFDVYLKAYCAARCINAATPLQVVEAFAESAAGLLLMFTRMLAKTRGELARLEHQRFKLEAQSELLAAMRVDADDVPPSSR